MKKWLLRSSFALLYIGWCGVAFAIDCKQFEYDDATEAEMRDIIESLSSTPQQLLDSVDRIYWDTVQKIQRSGVDEGTKKLLVEQEYKAKEQKAALLRCIKAKDIARKYGY